MESKKKQKQQLSLNGGQCPKKYPASPTAIIKSVGGIR
jgi:hypothetical protein